MTSRERLTTAYRRQQPDRVPVRVWAVDDKTRAFHPSYQPVIDAALAKTDLVGGWGMRWPASPVKTTSELRPSKVEGFEEDWKTTHTPKGPLLAVDLFNREGKPGYRKKHPIESIEDAERWLSIPGVPPEDDCATFPDRVREMGDRGVIMVGVGEPVYAVQSQLGPELFAFWSIEERDMLHRMMAVACERECIVIKHLLAHGVGPIFAYVGPEICIPPSQSVRDFEDFVIRYDKPWIDLIHDAGGIAWCHCHGSMRQVLEPFCACGIDVLQPLEPPPWGDIELTEIKRRAGDRLAFEGNIEKHELYTMEPGEMRERVRQAILDCGEGGGFVLGPSAGLMEWPICDDRTVANYLEYIDAGREYGKYPLKREV